MILLAILSFLFTAWLGSVLARWYGYASKSRTWWLAVAVGGVCHIPGVLCMWIVFEVLYLIGPSA